MLAILPQTEAVVLEEAEADYTLALAQMNDDALLKQAQAGDNDAFALLMRRLDSPIRRFIHRLLGVSDAEDDIVQDVFIALYRNLQNVDARRGVRPYVYRMVRNRSYDELRKQGRYHIQSLDEEPATEAYAPAETLADLSAGPEDVAHWLMIQLEVNAAMERLPENQRQALILYAEEGLSYAVIATIMDTTIGTIKSRLFHAKKNLRRLVRPDVLAALEIEFSEQGES